MSQAVTHVPRNGEGEKLAEEIVLHKIAPPPSIEAHEDFYSEFWVRRAENTYFFFPVGTLVQCLQRLLSQGGSLVVEKLPRPSFRLVQVLKPVVSHRPQPLAFQLMEREPKKICPHAAFQIWGGSGVLSSSLPGTWSSQIWLQKCPLAQGGFIFFCHPSK